MSEMELRFRVTASMAEAKAALDQGAQAFRDFGTQANTAMRTASAGQTAFRNQAAMTGNVAAQFNDIGVMLAAGQNPFQLAIQQGTQLSQVLAQTGGGVRGAVAALKAGFMSLLSPTTLLTVAIIAGGAALVQWAFGAEKAEDNAKATEKAIDGLMGILAEFNSNADLGAQKLDVLSRKYGEWADEVQATARWMAQVNVGQASAALNDVGTKMLIDLQATNEKLNDLMDVRRQYDQMLANGMSASNPAAQAQAAEIARLTEEAKLAAQAVGLTTDQVLTLDRVFSNMRGAKSMEDIRDRADDALTAIQAMYPAGEMVPPQLAEIAAHFQKVRDQAIQGLVVMEDMPEALGQASTAAGGLASAMTNVQMAANAALSRMIQLDIQRRTMNAAVQRQAAAPGGIGPAGMADGSEAYSSPRARAEAEARAAAEAFRNSVVVLPAIVEEAGSGVSRAVNKMVDDVKTPLQELADEMSRSLTDPLKDFITGSASAKDAGLNFLEAIRNKLIDVALQQAQMNLISPWLSNLFGGMQSGFGASVLSAFGVSAQPAAAPQARVAALPSTLLQVPSARPALSEAAAVARPRVGSVSERAAGGMGPGSMTTVNITPPAGYEAQVTERATPQGMKLDVIFDLVDRHIANGVRTGRGDTPAALSEAFGLRRAPR